MSRLLDDDQDELQERDRELTLSTGAILAIFLGLVLLCAVFFGFGYNLGHKSTTVPNAPLPAATNNTEPAGTGSSTFDNFKPSPSSPSAESTIHDTQSPTNPRRLSRATCTFERRDEARAGTRFAQPQLRPQRIHRLPHVLRNRRHRRQLLVAPSLCRSLPSPERTRTMPTCS